MKATIERLFVKMESLVAKYERAKEQQNQSLLKIDELTKQLELHQNTIQQLEEKNKILKLTSSIKATQEDNKAARKKINELVREIDRCIALLNN